MGVKVKDKVRIKSIVNKYLASEEYEFIQKGIEYYKGNHDIIEKKRVGIGPGGKKVIITGLPNSIIVDNQYARMVDQKINYILSDSPKIKTEVENELSKFLNDFLDKRFLKAWRNIAKDALNSKIGWLYVYKEKDELKYKRVPPTSVIPIWEDEEHDKLKELFRQYTLEEWDDSKEEFVRQNYIEHYTKDEVKIYKKVEDDLELIENRAYLQRGKDSYTWGKIPFIYFKYSEEEISLLNRIKTIQDAINTISSNFMDNMLEDARSTILVVKGMEAEDASTFRTNVSQYSFIGLPANENGVTASVDPIYIEVNSENYKTILALLKDKLIENSRGVDVKNDRVSQAPNELNIKSMYQDIELDANGMELQFQASFEHLQYFIKKHLNINSDEVLEVNFSRNTMINETGIIENLQKSIGLISDKTIKDRHPYVLNTEDEIEQVKAERTERYQEYDVYEVGTDDELLGE